jgi:bifunctional DNA-binding transcriptional regulator/antitoxin component of YhaV-PrlF toxin-antitoxin module
MPKIQEHNGQFRITIPDSIIKMKGIEKGDKFDFVEIQGYIALKPVR